MRVLIVNPSSRREATAGAYSESMYPMAPRGVAGIAAVAQALGHETFVEDQYATQSRAEDIAELVARKDIDLLGMSCLSPNMPMVENIARLVKTRRPQTHITLGNKHATYFARDILSQLPIDSIVMGEGERAFEGLLRALDADRDITGLPGISYRCGPAQSSSTSELKHREHREHGEKTDFKSSVLSVASVFKDVVLAAPAPQIEDLETLPRPAWNLFNIGHYVAPPRLFFRDRLLALEATRGCPWNCSYCSQNLFAPRPVRRAPAAVVDEIEWVANEFGVRSFGFVDAVFPPSISYGLEFARLMQERGLAGNTGWFGTTRPDMVTTELLRELKRGGCRFVLYGFESASARHLEAADKNISPEKAFEAMRMTKEAGLLSYGVFMIGFPNETAQEARATIAHAKKLDCDVASFARVTPYPGTPLYEQFKDDFPKETPAWQWNNQYRPEDGEAMWELPGLSHKQITALLREAMWKYYLRPRMIFRHIRLGIFSFSDIAKGAWMVVKEFFSTLL